jgi:peptidyl-prolyl cis-trans isomerase C
LPERPEIAEKLRAGLRGAMLEALRHEAAIESPITDADVQKYYETHLAQFKTPTRIAMNRIQLATREQASEVLKQLEADPSARHWNDLARERSLDKSSAMRGGSLGFVSPDGSTSGGGKVPATVLAAIEGVPDGHLVPNPIADGDRFDVLFRSQSSRAVERSLESEAPSIRHVVARERASEHVRATLESLRAKYVTEIHPENIDDVELSAAREPRVARRPGTLPKESRTARPVPVQGPSGLR